MNIEKQDGMKLYTDLIPKIEAGRGRGANYVYTNYHVGLWSILQEYGFDIDHIPNPKTQRVEIRISLFK